MIHVCFAIHDETGHYSKFAGTAILSLFENTNSKVTAHILHDNSLTQDNRDKFYYLAGRYGQVVKFYNVEELVNKNDDMLQKVKLILSEDTHFSVAMFYRFFIPQLFPQDIEKVIYLDSDVIVNLDIKKLWQNKMINEPLGVVPEVFNGIRPEKSSVCLCCRDGFVAPEDYFNSGVLLMNLTVLRNEKDTLLKGIEFRASHPEYKLYDQEILNYCFAKRALKLPVEYNCMVKEIHNTEKGAVKRRIYHYAGKKDGIGLDMKDPFNKLWMDFFIKTPWFNADIIGNIYDNMNQYISKAFEDLKASTRKYYSALVGKTRVFVIEDKKAIKWINSFFTKRNDDEYIVYNDNYSLNKLVDTITSSRNQKLFFIRVSGLSDILSKKGFVENQDFVNDFKFFPSQQYITSMAYHLIKAI